jgi:membrane protein
LELKPLGVIVPLITRVMPFVLLCAVYTFVYKFVPHTHVRFRSALLGGIVAGLLWQVAGVWFAMFVASSSSYAAVYSGFAVLILFLIWLQVGWQVVLVGGEVAYFHQHPGAYRERGARGEQSLRVREQLALLALVELTRRHLSGQPPSAPVQLAAALGAPVSSLEGLIDELVRGGILLRAAEPPGVTLGRPPEQIPVVEILDTLCGAEPPEPTSGRQTQALGVLQRRDQAIRQALEGVTLRSLAGPSE